MALDITYRDASYRERLGGRKTRQVEASIGNVRGFGANRTEARAELERELSMLAEHPWPMLLVTGDGTLMLVGVGRYDIWRPGSSARTSSVMTGDTFAETLADARAHADQSYGGSDLTREQERITLQFPGCPPIHGVGPAIVEQRADGCES